MFARRATFRIVPRRCTTCSGRSVSTTKIERACTNAHVGKASPSRLRMPASIIRNHTSLLVAVWLPWHHLKGPPSTSVATRTPGSPNEKSHTHTRIANSTFESGAVVKSAAIQQRRRSAREKASTGHADSVSRSLSSPPQRSMSSARCDLTCDRIRQGREKWTEDGLRSSV